MPRAGATKSRRHAARATRTARSGAARTCRSLPSSARSRRSGSAPSSADGPGRPSAGSPAAAPSSTVEAHVQDVAGIDRLLPAQLLEAGRAEARRFEQVGVAHHAHRHRAGVPAARRRGGRRAKLRRRRRRDERAAGRTRARTRARPRGSLRRGRTRAPGRPESLPSTSVRDGATESVVGFDKARAASDAALRIASLGGWPLARCVAMPSGRGSAAEEVAEHVGLGHFADRDAFQRLAKRLRRRRARARPAACCPRPRRAAAAGCGRAWRATAALPIRWRRRAAAFERRARSAVSKERGAWRSPGSGLGETIAGASKGERPNSAVLAVQIGAAPAPA